MYKENILLYQQTTQKWKEDKQFVADYKSDTLPDVIFNNIILKS